MCRLGLANPRRQFTQMFKCPFRRVASHMSRITGNRGFIASRPSMAPKQVKIMDQNYGSSQNYGSKLWIHTNPLV